jgi:hypothetical protein
MTRVAQGGAIRATDLLTPLAAKDTNNKWQPLILDANGNFPVASTETPADLATATATIANAASLSAEVDLGLGRSLVGIIVPSTWTTAVLSFAASPTSGGTFYPLYNAAGSEVVTGSIAGGTAVWVALDPADFAGVRYLKVRSGTNAAPVNQAGADTLTLITRQL